MYTRNKTIGSMHRTRIAIMPNMPRKFWMNARLRCERNVIIRRATDATKKPAHHGTGVMNGSGSVSLVMNNNKTFTLSWGGHTFVGNYVMEYDYEEEYASQFYRKVAAHLTSTTEIEKDGRRIKPNWTLNYQDPNRPASPVIQGYSISNGNYYYRWPETSNGGGIRVHLVDPDDPEATNP